MEQKWFESWFDSSYYHLLYQHRNQNEAASFITELLNFLQIPRAKKVLDLACGRGRHSRFISRAGCEVLGLDISSQSIKFARQFENEYLKFQVGDMRSFNYHASFDYVFNLFTSFGYFETQDEHLAVIESIYKSLKVGGLLVLDFFNTPKILNNLVPSESQTHSGITFHLKRYYEKGQIVKEIEFEDGGQKYHFQERVQAFGQAFFEQIFRGKWQIIYRIGNYKMDSYKPDLSDRMIFIVQKIA